MNIKMPVDKSTKEWDFEHQQSWETFRVSITSSTPNSVVSLETVKGGVLNEEMRRKAQGSSSHSEVLVTENRGRSQKKEQKGGRENSKSKSKSRYKNIKCHYCHRIGHIQKNFFLLKKENKGKKGNKKQRGCDDDRVTTSTSDDLVILRDYESINLGISHEKTSPKTPQLNGLSERMNWTLVERVRCMLSEAKLPKHYWGEALYTTMHFINLTPTVILNSEVPNKVWFGKNVKYDHLRVFGCKAFVHVPKDEDPSWIQSQSSVSSFVMVKMNLATSCMIL
uniref:Uncharacterized protein LOC105852768 n=1 Tax=Cicer arietinum TaxID=3827 RepID=A0A1S3EIY4_CICAR|nr:uncharacterized protein LOC105852768 [Cicer arietinum]